MKKYLISILITCIYVILSAFPIEIDSYNIHRDIKIINQLRLDVDSADHHRGIIRLNIRDDDDLVLLLANGFDYRIVRDEAKEGFEAWQREKIRTGNPLTSYFSYAEMESFLQTKALDFGDICSLESIGTTVQNRDIYALKISANPLVNTDKPEIKLIASIHGDEPVGYQVMLKLIDELTLGYGTDERLTDIVDNTELYIIPLFNPDGYVNGVRYNANRVDLNRNFPMPTGETNPDGYAHQPETLAMMNFSQEHNFILGINFHGGALVINYPWDYSFQLTEDDALLRELSLGYASHNSPMYNSNEFENGITNGAEWYVITGSMQDWNYAFSSNIELTAEIGNSKWPAASTLGNYWNDNKESILSFIEMAQKGVKGSITNASGEPLPATILLFGQGKDIHNDAAVGDYHRVLLPGQYRMMVSSEGYIPEIVDITVPAEGFLQQDFTLDEAEEMRLRGIVRSGEDLSPVAGVEVSFSDEGMGIVSDGDGVFEIEEFYEGYYHTKVSSGDTMGFAQYVQLRKWGEQNHLVLPLIEPSFYEDFESGLSNWTTQGGWGIVNDMGSSVLADSPIGNYPNNANFSARLDEPVDLSNVVDPMLSFRARWELENSYDFVHLEVSANNANWTPLDSFTGSQATYLNKTYSLKAYEGESIYLRFRLKSDYFYNYDGIYIDDIVIRGQDISKSYVGDLNGDGYWDNRDLSELLRDALRDEPLSDLALADLNSDGYISPIDAYILLNFLKEPQFNIPIDDGQHLFLPDAELAIEATQAVMTIGLDEGLRSLRLKLPFPIEGVVINSEANSELYRLSEDGQALGLIRSEGSIGDELLLYLATCTGTFSVEAEINGHPQSFVITPSACDPPTAPELPLALHQNYPNPFNPHTTISFSLPEMSKASLKVYNLKGQLVRSVINGELSAGLHQVLFDGKDEKGRDLSSGIYYYKLDTAGKSISKKMVLCK